jgi:hypothetical protein
VARRLGDQALVINIAASVPDERLADWMDHDSRFRETWHHQRTDMHDTSQSGYDMALACFGVQRRLTDQEIVDLIVHGRRFRGAKQSQSLEYFRRTISRAGNGVEERLAANGVAAFDPRSPDEAQPHSIPEHGDAAGRATADLIARASLCEQLSARFGVRVLRILKITGAEPVYLMQLDDGRIEFPNAAKLISKSFVRSAFAARAGKIIPDFKTKTWELLAQMLLDACTIEPGTEDMELDGLGRLYVGRYLAEAQFIASPAGVPEYNRLSPVIHEDRVTVSAADLRLYINKTTSQNITVKSVVAMLAALGSKSFRLRGHGFKEQGRWALPVEEFEPKDYRPNPMEDGRAE